MALAHEIKQPLHSLNLNLELLQKRIGRAQGVPPEIAGPLEALARVVDRINGCLEAVSVRLVPEPVPPAAHDVTAAIRAAVARVAPAARRAGVRVIQELASNLPPIPYHDRQIAVALDSLLDNAVRASNRGGTITIRAALAGDEVRIAVIDSGEGMTPDVLRRAVEIGYSTRSADGTGLTVAKFVVYHHLGGIQIDSHPKQGTTVTITLPAQAETD